MKINNIMIYGILVMLIFMSLSGSINVNGADTTPTTMEAHLGIVINDYGDLTAPPSVNGITSGSGTEGDPYIIEMWEIDMSGQAGSCIYIANLPDVYITIRWCFLFNAWIPNGADDKPSGISIINANHVTVDGCGIFDCYANPTSSGVYFNNAEDITVKNSDISYCSSGIYGHAPFGSGDYTFYNNDINDISVGSGIGVSGGATFDVSRNVIHSIDSGQFGIVLEGGLFEPSESIQCYVTNNTCYGITNVNPIYGFGIALGFVDNSTICFNTLRDNSQGLGLVYSEYNYIFNNTIEENNYGIYVDESSFDHVFWNRFINNTNQYYLFTADPYWWNQTYENGGGNYWSDYTGADIYSGVGQNETNRDYIGDTPYNISTITDYYPLISATGFINLTIPKVHDTTVNETIIFFSFYETMDESVNGSVVVNGTEFNGTWVNKTVYEVNVTSVENITINRTLVVNMTDFKSDDGYIMENYTESVTFIALPPPETLPIEEPVEPEEESSSYQMLQDVLLAIMPFILLLVILIFVIKMIWGIFEEDKKRK